MNTNSHLCRVAALRWWCDGCADVVEFCSCIVQLLLLLQCEVDLMGAHLRNSRVFTMGPLRSHATTMTTTQPSAVRPSASASQLFGIIYLFIRKFPMQRNKRMNEWIMDDCVARVPLPSHLHYIVPYRSLLSLSLSTWPRRRRPSLVGICISI